MMLLIALAKSPYPHVRKTLADIAQLEKGADLHPRRAAIIAMGVGPSPDEVDLLASLAKNKDPYVRAPALLALGMAAKEGALLESGLRDKDGLVRGFAALGLGLCRRKEALGALEARLLDADPMAQSGAALALGRLQTKEAVSALAASLENPPVHRSEALPLQPGYAGYLAVADQQAREGVNYLAIGLGLSGRPEALAPLVKGLLSKENHRIVTSSIGLLLLKDPKALPDLTKLVDHGQYIDVPQFALLAIAALKKPETLPILTGGLDKREWGTRVAAGMSLVIFGDPQAAPVLEKHLDDKQPVVRDSVALSFDLLTPDETRKLTLGPSFKGDPRNRVVRRVGVEESQRLLNELLPKDFKLPIAP